MFVYHPKVAQSVCSCFSFQVWVLLILRLRLSSTLLVEFKPLSSKVEVLNYLQSIQKEPDHGYRCYRGMIPYSVHVHV